MRLEQITYFLSVADCGSITAAAKALFISQPALSKQISLLEQEIGVPLFARNARGVSLTEAGVQFEKDLKNILKELDHAKKNAVLAGRAKKPLLNIGCFDGIYVDDFLPAVYEYLKENASGQKLVLHKCTLVDGAEFIRKGKIDLWFTFAQAWDMDNEFCHKNLVHRKGALLYSARSELGKRESVTWEDFKEESCILVDPSSCPGMHRHALNTMKRLNLSPENIEYVDNIGTQVSSVKLGRGYCFLSEDVVHGNPGFRKLSLPEDLGVDVIAVWSKQNELVTALMENYGG